MLLNMSLGALAMSHLLRLLDIDQNPLSIENGRLPDRILQCDDQNLLVLNLGHVEIDQVIKEDQDHELDQDQFVDLLQEIEDTGEKEDRGLLRETIVAH